MVLVESRALPFKEREATSRPVRALAIGSGNLQRALTHELLDALYDANLYNGGIFIGQPRGWETAHALNSLTNGYPVVSFTSSGIREVKSVRSVCGAVSLSTAEGRELFYDKAREDLDLILVGVTEKGIHPDEPGMTVLFETLKRFRSHHAEESTIAVMDTDNLRNNGDRIQAIMLAFAKRGRDVQLLKWLSENVDFLNTMVDRIVPKQTAIPASIREEARRVLRTDEGSELDILTTFAEPMPTHWALLIEDKKRRLRIPFDKLLSPQVIVTDEPIDSYHEWKLRLANSLHIPGLTAAIALAYGPSARIDIALGENAALRRHAEAFARITSQLVSQDVPIAGMDPEGYALAFLERVANIPDDASRINVNLAVKVYERLAPSVFSPAYTNLSDFQKDLVATSLASVLRFLTPVEDYRGRDYHGREYALPESDNHIADIFRNALSQDNFGNTLHAVRRFCNDEQVWQPHGNGKLLSENKDFSRRLEFYYLLFLNTNVLDVLNRQL